MRNPKLISHRRHLPVPHSTLSQITTVASVRDMLTGTFPPQDHCNARGNHNTRTLAEEPAVPAVGVLARQINPSTRPCSAACVSPTKSDRCTAAERLFADCRSRSCMSLQAISGTAVPASDSSFTPHVRAAASEPCAPCTQAPHRLTHKPACTSFLNFHEPSSATPAHFRPTVLTRRLT